MAQGYRSTSVSKCAHSTLDSSITRRSFLALGTAAVASACKPNSAGQSSDALAFSKEGFREGALLYPRAIGVHHDRVYVIDKSGRLQRFSFDGEYIDGWHLPDQDNGTPTAIAFDGETILVPDTHNSRILKFDETGTLIGKWGEYGIEPGQFVYPTGLAIGPEGHYYISEYGTDAERVQVFDSEGHHQRLWGEAGQRPGTFSRAMAIEMDSEQRVHIADTGNHRIQTFDIAGKCLGVVGAAGTNGAGLAFPFDISLAPDDSLLAIDYGTHRLSRFDADGRFMGEYGTPGRSPGSFHGPRGVAVAPEAGWVFVADTGNHRIQRIPLESVA